ncbi:hypothetical protein FOC1_g10003644 [Fusarium oxysporum f. sp. cubense race 1]|uniref:Uncharacterized protein n=1 Tax=Fusarium oxysporum f. sp. cubense (strain race 1) TaxID=1229664 RepID=N4U550_FUSC1|nr:hypothetical protein FOC1_g10003644 [Fusarium oxysporum f. sp. cubense race 1]
MSGESKASLSSQYQWENILTPAPLALNALGACAVATGSQKANTTFAPPKEGFKYLSDFAGVKLHTNLSNWDIVGRQVVEKLANSLATALNQAMPTPSASKPNDADDPAYSQVVRDLIYWELLSTAFVGTTDGIAWDRAGQTATFAAKMLAHSQKPFGAHASGSEPSQQYKSALDSVCRTANEIMTEVEQSGKLMGYTAPSKDSEAVKSWQRDFLSNYTMVITLNATAKSFLGSIANGSTVPSQRGNMDIETVQVHAKTAQAQAVVESAKTRLRAASEALAATRETNQNSTGILVEQQERLNHINAKIESLKNSAP